MSHKVRGKSWHQVSYTMMIIMAHIRIHRYSCSGRRQTRSRDTERSTLGWEPKGMTTTNDNNSGGCYKRHIQTINTNTYIRVDMHTIRNVFSMVTRSHSFVYSAIHPASTHKRAIMLIFSAQINNIIAKKGGKLIISWYNKVMRHDSGTGRPRWKQLQILNTTLLHNIFNLPV